MGCDIHMVLERKVGDGGWVGVHNFPYYQINGGHAIPPATDRNYERFAKLAGVRGGGPDPKGTPEDVSVLAQMEIDSWGSDGHSHSWMSVGEAAQIFLETAWEPSDYMTQYPTAYFFGVDPDKSEQYRIVFWFDN